MSGSKWRNCTKGLILVPTPLPETLAPTRRLTRIERFYARIVAMAAGRNAVTAMGLISFAESSFLPLPPDFLLIPMILAQPRRAWWLATVCTVTSVVGGYVG